MKSGIVSYTGMHRMKHCINLRIAWKFVVWFYKGGLSYTMTLSNICSYHTYTAYSSSHWVSMRTCVPEACVRGRDKQSHPTVSLITCPCRRYLLQRCDMAFAEHMHCNKPNITYLLADTYCRHTSPDISRAIGTTYRIEVVLLKTHMCAGWYFENFHNNLFISPLNACFAVSKMEVIYFTFPWGTNAT